MLGRFTRVSAAAALEALIGAICIVLVVVAGAGLFAGPFPAV